MPLLTVEDFINNSVEVITPSLLNLSLGASYSYRLSSRWGAEAILRAQWPLSASATGAKELNIDPSLAFDGSLAASYRAYKDLYLQFAWYGQYLNFNYQINSATQQLGQQSLLQSHMELRAGFRF